MITRYTALAFVFAFLAITSATATDFVAKQLDYVLVAPGVYNFKLKVRNDNVLGDAFAVRFEVFLGMNASGTKVYDYTVEQPTLAPFTERDVVSEQSYSPTVSGSTFVRASVVYGSEIDPGDNIIDLIFTALRPGCVAKETWHAGPSIAIDQQLTTWPAQPMLGDKLRPGDVVGIRALVSDLDLLEQGCGCAEFDTTVIRGPYPDAVVYEWTIEGEGTLLQSISGDRNSVMWQIPVCPSGENFGATVRLRVRNPGGKGGDAELSGSIQFNVSTSRIYAADAAITWDPYTYNIGAIITPLTPQVPGVVEAIQGRSCNPIPPKWEKGPGIVNGGIKKISAPHLCPEYLTLMSVTASDVDNYQLVCESTTTSCSPSDTLTNTSSDQLSYTWSIIGGAGELPQGNTGASVVVRRSASKPTILQCVINDGGLQADDDPITVLDTLPPAGKPKAFVGLGDDEGTSPSKLGSAVWDYWSGNESEETYGGRSGALRSAFNSMVTKLTDAGYDLVTNDSLLVTDFELVIKNSCIKTFVFVGHGASGHINMARMNVGGWGTPTRSASHVESFSNSQFNCKKHPFLRDLVLLACETMKGSWNDVQVYGRSHGWKTTKFFASIRSWAYWSYSPLPPIILTVD